MAAATAGVLSHFQITAPFGSTDLMKHATYAVQSALVRAPLEMLISRRDMAETLRAQAIGIVANSLGAWASSHIGELSHPVDGGAPRIDPFTHQALHFGVGAGTAAIMGEDILSGGAGQVAGELAGEFYRNTFMQNLRPNTAAWREAATRGADIARISAIGFATICGLDPSIAAHTAGQAAENNAFLVQVAARATRATANLTDSPRLHEVADNMEDLDQAYDRLDGFCDDVDDAVMDMAVTSWNQGIDNAQELLPHVQSFVDQTLAVCPHPCALLSHAALPVAGAVVKGGLDMLRLPETRTEAAIEGALLVGTAGVGKGLRAAYPYVEPFVLPYAKRAGAYISREAAAMGSALEKSSVLKYFGKDAAPATQAANQNALRIRHQFTVPGGAPIKPMQLPGASAPATSSSSSGAALTLRPDCMVQAQLLKNSLIADAISAGHAFEKHILHRGEFPGWIRTRTQLKVHVENILNDQTTQIISVGGGKTLFVHRPSGSVVLHNPKAIDRGTVFQPEGSIDTFLRNRNWDK